MRQIKRILVPIDFSESAAVALGPAAKIAKATGAKLHLLHAVVLHDFGPLEGESTFPDIAGIQEAMAGKAMELFDRLAEGLETPEVEIEKAERRGTAAAPLILDYAREQQIDLIVMATHGRRGVRRLLLGSVTEEVVQHAACAVLTIHPSFDATAVARPLKVLAPVDFSASAEAAAAEAADIARRLDAQLELLHVLQRPIHPASYDAFVDLGPDVEELREVLKPRLDAQAAAIGQGLEVTTRIAIGAPAQTIAEVAERDRCSLIVIGSRGLGGVAHLLLGSVAERVVRLAGCPVLTLKGSPG